MRCLLLAKSKANRRQIAGNKLSLLGPQSSTDSPKAQETGGRNEARGGGGGERWGGRGRTWGQTHHTGYLGRFGSFWMVQSKDSILREKSGLCYHPGQHLTPSVQCRDESWGKERNTESNEKNNTMSVKQRWGECLASLSRGGRPRETEMDGEKKQRARENETEGETLHELEEK